MIKFYQTGADFLDENTIFLNTNKYLTMFFVIDAKFIEHADQNNYAVLVTNGNSRLVALKKEPYNLIVFGDGALCGELFDALVTNGYCFTNLMGEESLCDSAVKHLERYGKNYYEALAMDFMIATQVTEPSCSQVTCATEDDVDELFECLQCFVKDCGLLDVPTLNGVRKHLSAYRIYKAGGKIVSMAIATDGVDNSKHITEVYTRPEYRNCGYARKVVNTLKNQILEQGKVATLNVDKANPYSNRLYSSLGFTKLFSQGEYRQKQ